MKTVILIFLLLLTVVFNTSYLYGCSCMTPPPPQEALEKSKAVFLGTVLSIGRSGYKKEALISVEKSWKGINEEKIPVATPSQSSHCGFNFEIGERYLVYATSGGESVNLETNLCTRTKHAKQAEDDLQILGDSVWNPGELDKPKPRKKRWWQFWRKKPVVTE